MRWYIIGCCDVEEKKDAPLWDTKFIEHKSNISFASDIIHSIFTMPENSARNKGGLWEKTNRCRWWAAAKNFTNLIEISFVERCAELHLCNCLSFTLTWAQIENEREVNIWCSAHTTHVVRSFPNSITLTFRSLTMFVQCSTSQLRFGVESAGLKKMCVCVRVNLDHMFVAIFDKQ